MTPQSPDRAALAARLARGTSFIAVVLALLAGALHPAGAAAQANVVRGTVRTTDGRPVPGATIRISGSVGAARGTTVKTQTDARGNYSIAVRPGDYDVDGVVDLTFEGQTFRQLLLDRSSEGCERQLSQRGIVRDFVLRLSGLAKCTPNLDPNDPMSYYGAALTVNGGAISPSTLVRFTFTPMGPLADGTTGRTLTFERTGEMLARGGGRIGQTTWLYDIPLGRYRVSAAARAGNGAWQALVIRNDEGGPSAEAIELSFSPRLMLPFGMRNGGITIVGAGSGAPAPAPDRRPSSVPAPAPAPSPAGGAGLPTGRYECTYNSEYAGPIPNGRTIVIVDANRYQAWGSTGEYAASSPQSAQWRTGPLAARGVTVRFSEVSGRPTLTITGGAAAEDPNGTNQCTRH